MVVAVALIAAACAEPIVPVAASTGATLVVETPGTTPTPVPIAPTATPIPPTPDISDDPDLPVTPPPRPEVQPGLSNDTVSYTHLTLPTICSV